MTGNKLIETALRDRAVSAFPLSIGTSLAIESLFKGENEPYDKNRAIPNRVKLSDYDVHYFSIEVLIKNIFASVERKALMTSPEYASVEISKTAEEEISYLLELYSAPEFKDTKLIFYRMSRKTYYSRLSKVIKIRVPSTDLQIITDGIVNRTMDFIEKNNPGFIVNLDISLPTNFKRVLITTGVNLDLLNANKFSKFDLLESHTGKLKKALEFNTRYYKMPKESLTRLPFLEKLLYIMGDNSLVTPQKIAIRRKILDISKESNWTPLTTETKVKHYLYRDKELRDLYQSLPTIF